MEGGMLRTDRLELVAATRELLALDVSEPEALARRLDAELPTDWPPGTWDVGAARSIRESLDEDRAGWWSRYIVVVGPPRVLGGVVGFHGPPRDGLVEVGYTLAEAHRSRGLATEACQALFGWAREHGAREVVAETEPENAASRRVMEKLGMRLQTDGVDRVRYGASLPHDG